MRESDDGKAQKYERQGPAEGQGGAGFKGAPRQGTSVPEPGEQGKRPERREPGGQSKGQHDGPQSVPPLAWPCGSRQKEDHDSRG